MLSGEERVHRRLDAYSELQSRSEHGARWAYYVWVDLLHVGRRGGAQLGHRLEHVA